MEDRRLWRCVIICRGRFTCELILEVLCCYSLLLLLLFFGVVLNTIVSSYVAHIHPSLSFDVVMNLFLRPPNIITNMNKPVTIMTQQQHRHLT